MATASEFRSILDIRLTESETMHNEQTPERDRGSIKKTTKASKLIKKQISRAAIDDEPAVLPPIQPIHQVGVEMRLNFYGHPNEAMFKKTTTKLSQTKKEEYVLLGKRMG